jgi:rod shape-determining protein MreD
VENYTIRLVMSFSLSLLSSVMVAFVSRFLLGLELDWDWYTMLYTAVGNSVIALFLFPLLDRLQVRD